MMALVQFRDVTQHVSLCPLAINGLFNNIFRALCENALVKAKKSFNMLWHKYPGTKLEEVHTAEKSQFLYFLCTLTAFVQIKNDNESN